MRIGCLALDGYFFSFGMNDGMSDGMCCVCIELGTRAARFIGIFRVVKIFGADNDNRLRSSKNLQSYRSSMIGCSLMLKHFVSFECIPGNLRPYHSNHWNGF